MVLHTSLIRYVSFPSKLKMLQTRHFRASCTFIELSFQGSHMRKIHRSHQHYCLSFCYLSAWPVFVIFPLWGNCLDSGEANPD